MLAQEIKPGVWEIVIEGDVVRFWITERGILSQRVEHHATNGRTFSCAPQRLGFGDLLAKTEKQSTMF